MRQGEEPVVVELKERMSLALLLQGVDRLGISPTVYIAFRVGKGQSVSWKTRRKRVIGLLRRLGLGLLTVTPKGKVVAALDPVPYQPRVNAKRRARLLKEFSERVGDPEAGGSSSRQRLTAYRQDALRCADALEGAGLLKACIVRDRTGVERAGAILRANHYGWFKRESVGHYRLTAKGSLELADWAGALDDLKSAGD
ncbi:MAG: DUF2161 domain-containing phosphodiesterase [Planctomycetes bacterium]|nr:DUF2161 domain-containing phosphodiesterase [Planctomycetota bacterium]